MSGPRSSVAPRIVRSVLSALTGLVVAAALGCATTGAGKAKGADAKTLPKPDRELDFPGQAYLQRYDNGLSLFVIPDNHTRMVQFDVRQAVGSREDPEGKYGLAHFVEHLMFQIPTDGEGSPPIMSVLPQHTLFYNAYTSNDETHYIHTGVASNLETYMKYTAQRLNFDCDAIPEQEFLRERDVVRQEIRWRRDDVSATVFTNMLALAFPKGHPYRQDASGNDLQIASISRDDACDFIKRYYTPSQAIVVVSGDVNPGDVKALADAYLAPLPKVTPPPRAEVAPPSFSTGEATLTAPVKKPSAVILFAMPRRFTDDAVVAQVAQETLFLAVSFFVGGRGSAVKDWGGAFLGGKEAQVFGVSVETRKASELDRAVDEVLDAIVRAFSPELKGKEQRSTYDSSRQRARLGVVSNLANVQSRAGAYADYLEEGDKPRFYRHELGVIDDLTPDQVQVLGRRIFARDRALVIKVVPDGKADDVARAPRADYDYKPRQEETALELPADIDPEEAKRPLVIDDIASAEGQSLEYELDNGMRVVLVRSTNLPVMDVQLIVGAGQLDAPDKPALAELAYRTYGLREDNREAQNTIRNFDFAGGIFGGRSGALSTTFTSRGLSIYLDFILAGVSERVLQAEYRTGSLDNWKQAQRDALKKESQAQAARRSNAFYTALYGEGHPHVRAAITDRSKLREISLSDLESFRARHYRAANSTLIITGGFDIELALQYIEAYFGAPKLRNRKASWLAEYSEEARPKTPEPRPGDTRTLAQVDKKAIQTDVTIAFPLAEIYGEHHAALSVLAEMLSFEVSAIREQLGASYGVYGRLGLERPQVTVGGSVDSARAGEAVAAILAGIQRVRDGDDFDRRFAFARRKVLRRMIQTQGDSKLLADQLAQAVRNGVAYEYFEELAAEVSALTPAAVKAEVERALDPSRAVTLVQGPEAGVKDAIAKAGLTAVTYLPEAVHAEDED
ncbi:MAG: insulinase family protein [Myxococcales bacterium]|nr:insulinase family protein [Myxococcales bacterium]